MKIQKLTLNKDYKYSFPYGMHDSPQLEVISGNYEGLKFDIVTSDVSKLSNESNFKMNCSYKILKVWNNISSEKVNGEVITLYEDDNKYIASLVYNFIREFNRKNRKK